MQGLSWKGMGPRAPLPQLTHTWVQQAAFPAQRGPRQLPHLLSHPRPVLRWSLVHLCLRLCFQAPQQEAARLYTDIHTHIGEVYTRGHTRKRVNRKQLPGPRRWDHSLAWSYLPGPLGDHVL